MQVVEVGGLAIVAGKLRNGHQTCDCTCRLGRLVDAGVLAAPAVVVGQQHDAGAGQLGAHDLGDLQQIAGVERHDSHMAGGFVRAGCRGVALADQHGLAELAGGHANVEVAALLAAARQVVAVTAQHVGGVREDGLQADDRALRVADGHQQRAVDLGLAGRHVVACGDPPAVRADADLAGRGQAFALDVGVRGGGLRVAPDGLGVGGCACLALLQLGLLALRVGVALGPACRSGCGVDLARLCVGPVAVFLGHVDQRGDGDAAGGPDAAPGVAGIALAVVVRASGPLVPDVKARLA